jgi:hypothetical protein
MEPRARTGRLLVEDVGEELVILDQDRQVATSLNRTAAVVWRHCDGATSVPELVGIVQREVDPAADEDLVWVTLDELGRSDLLEAPVERSADDLALSRRRFVRRLGIGAAAAVLLPEIGTIFVPAAAQVKSPVVGR